MKFFFVTVCIAVSLFATVLVISSKEKEASIVVEKIHNQIKNDLNELQNWYDKEWMHAVEKGKEEDLHASFARGRQLYKNAEWAIEFFFPQTAKELNGPPLPEIEAEEHVIIPPSGFQVIEELIFPFEQENRLELILESKKWNSLLHRLKTLWKEHQFRDDQVWAAIRFELMRTASLGLSGFDTPLSLTSINEIRNALAGIQKALAFYLDITGNRDYSRLADSFEKTYAYLEKNNDFISFDRVYLITKYLQPLSKLILELQLKNGITVQNIYAVDLDKASFFDTASFNTNFFTPGMQSWINEEKVMLGRMLFNDPVLSGNNKMACVSCHKPGKAFADGLTRSKAFDGKDLKRNTPTVLYAGLQQSQFYDMRANFLEDQVRNVIESRDEIHGSLQDAAYKISKQDKYVQLFNKAFNHNKDSISEWEIQVALAGYIRSLAPFTSRFDWFLQQKEQLSSEEKRGFNLFMGKAKCGTCHFAPLFNGTVPPMFTSTESEVIGSPSDKVFSGIDSDKGRYGIREIEELRFAFKTPTLRNIALTAPYMHNGVYQSLEEVIDFYNDGGAAGRGKELSNQTLPSDPLNLTATEKKALVTFLNTLTDKEYLDKQ